MKLKWAGARPSTGYPVNALVCHEPCGLRFEEEPAADAPAGTGRRPVFHGEDVKGTALEVMAVELGDGSLLVIHALPATIREPHGPR